MVDIVTLQSLPATLSAVGTEPLIAVAGVLDGTPAGLSIAPVIAMNTMLPATLASVGATRLVVHITTLSTTVPITGATSFYMRGWDADGGQQVYWLSSAPDSEPAFTDPPAVGDITNRIIVGDR